MRAVILLSRSPSRQFESGFHVHRLACAIIPLYIKLVKTWCIMYNSHNSGYTVGRLSTVVRRLPRNRRLLSLYADVIGNAVRSGNNVTDVTEDTKLMPPTKCKSSSASVKASEDNTTPKESGDITKFSCERRWKR